MTKSAKRDGGVLLVTPHLPADRLGAFDELGKRVKLTVLTFDGKAHHFRADTDLQRQSESSSRSFRQIECKENQVFAICLRGKWNCIIVGTAGKTAFPSAWLAAKASGTPLVVWAAIWHEPRSLKFTLSRPLIHRIYRDADAIATYGSHVNSYLSGLGISKLVAAPQAVDQEFWNPNLLPQTDNAAPNEPVESFRALFVGRDEPGKGLQLLLDAWRKANQLGELPANSKLTVIGPEGDDLADSVSGIEIAGRLTPTEVRQQLSEASCLIVPSEATPIFQEPWGLVCNEAMHMGVPVIASDTVGAAAGGLVRDRRNGLVFVSGNSDELKQSIVLLASDQSLQRRLSLAAKADSACYGYQNWADGMHAAIKLAQLLAISAVDNLEHCIEREDKIDLQF